MCIIVILLPGSGIKAQLEQNKGGTGTRWEISGISFSIAQWAAGIMLTKGPEIKSVVLSTRDDGVFLDAGINKDVEVGQVFEIYRASHENKSEEIIGKVKVAWTREDYCFAVPFGQIDLSKVTTVHSARLVFTPPVLQIIPDSSRSHDSRLNQLIVNITSLLAAKSIQIANQNSNESVWRMHLALDEYGTILNVSLLSPGSTVASSVMFNLITGQKFGSEPWLDESYLDGTASPFAHYLAPPGKRLVRIASGNLIAGKGDELAVLYGSDLYIYDISGTEAKLLNSFSVSIPSVSVRHREDAGSLELIDLDDNGLDEVCVAPPGGSRGEIWSYNGHDWIPLGFLPAPARAVEPQLGAVLIGQYLDNAPAFNQRSLKWYFPLSDNRTADVFTGFSPLAVAAVSRTNQDLPDIIAVNRNGVLMRVLTNGQQVMLGGQWGTSIKMAYHRNGSVVLLTRPSLLKDSLVLVDSSSGAILAEYPYPNGPIIDIAVGDINMDGRSEIMTAAINPEGVHIYY